MNDYLLMVAATEVPVLVLLILLLREYKKLKHDYRLLEDRQRRNNEDVAGLCSAAVQVDQRLAANDVRLNSIIDTINAYQPPQFANPPDRNEQAQGYDYVIQKIRRGFGVDELVKECGLTRDEAVLLISLHGGKRS